jgi:hypothetical protein
VQRMIFGRRRTFEPIAPAIILISVLRSHDARSPRMSYPCSRGRGAKVMGSVELPAVALIGLLIATVGAAASLVWLAKSVSIA